MPNYTELLKTTFTDLLDLAQELGMDAERVCQYRRQRNRAMDAGNARNVEAFRQSLATEVGGMWMASIPNS